MELFINSIVEGLGRHFGQTVTIFTKSGGLSGSGFTGTLVFADCNVVKLITCLGAPPCCPLGSDCADGFGGCGLGAGYGAGYNGYNGYNGLYGNGGFYGNGRFGNGLGSIVTIPTCAIAAFVNNTIG
jgi:hypothetical protein